MRNFLILFIDNLASFSILIFFIFIVIDERFNWKKAFKIWLLAGGPTGIVNYVFLILLDLDSVLAYACSSACVFIFTTIQVALVWKQDRWRAISIVGIAAIMQVSLVAAVSVVVEYLAAHGVKNGVGMLQRMYLLCLPISFGVGFLLRKMSFGRIIRYLLDDEKHKQRIAIEILLLELVAEVFFTLRMGVNSESMFTYSAAVIILLLLLISIIVYLSSRVENAHKLQLQHSMILQQQMYVEHLEQLQKEMRAFRHDYKNMLSGMYLYAKEGEVVKIQKVLEKLEIDFDNKIGEKIHTATQIGNIQIPEVKSLVLSKMTKMNKEGIRCSLEVLYPFAQIKMDVWDFNRCMGILIDNAIEAAAVCEHPSVELLFMCQGGFLTVRVTNPCEQDVDLAHIWVEGYSTKGENRGLGLANYQRILEQYPEAVPLTSYENHIFAQELTVEV